MNRFEIGKAVFLCCSNCDRAIKGYSEATIRDCYFGWLVDRAVEVGWLRIFIKESDNPIFICPDCKEGKKQMIIAFGHEKLQGKDTAAGAIEEAYPNTYVKGFADALYDVCQRLVPEIRDIGEYLDNPDLKLETIDRLGMTHREVLLRVGKSLRETLGGDCFVQALDFESLKYFDADVIIADLRFPEEVKALKEQGAYLVKIVRPSVPRTSDSADDALLDFDGWDEILMNDCSLEEFKQRAVNLYERVKNGL